MSESKPPQPTIRGYTVTVEVISHRFNVEVEAEGLDRETAESTALAQVKALVEREGLKVLDAFDAEHTQVRLRAESAAYRGSRSPIVRKSS